MTRRFTFMRFGDNQVSVRFDHEEIGTGRDGGFDKRTGGATVLDFRFRERVAGAFVDHCQFYAHFGLISHTKFFPDDSVILGDAISRKTFVVGDVQINWLPVEDAAAAVKRQQQADDPALRYDAGKARFDLIPADALEELAAVYAFGATKYAEDNWVKGMGWRRCIGSALRHIFKWSMGERDDPESGRHHLAHAAWNLFTLIAYEKRGLGTDDRLKTNKEG